MTAGDFPARCLFAMEVFGRLGVVLIGFFGVETICERVGVAIVTSEEI